jgi:hypothetical protein
MTHAHTEANSATLTNFSYRIWLAYDIYETQIEKN